MIMQRLRNMRICLPWKREKQTEECLCWIRPMFIESHPLSPTRCHSSRAWRWWDSDVCSQHLSPSGLVPWVDCLHPPMVHCSIVSVSKMLCVTSHNTVLLLELLPSALVQSYMVMRLTEDLIIRVSFPVPWHPEPRIQNKYSVELGIICLTFEMKLRKEQLSDSMILCVPIQK